MLAGREKQVLFEYVEEGRRPSRHDEVPDSVWRSLDRAVQHAAVTLGEGWALHKPSQGWMSPTKVLTTGECKASARESGRRLERRTLLG